MPQISLLFESSVNLQASVVRGPSTNEVVCFQLKRLRDCACPGYAVSSDYMKVRA